MPLLMMKMGQKAILREILWNDVVKKKLHSMGLVPGACISIVSTENRGSIILDVKGSRLALGQGVVSKIVVDLII